MLETDSQTSFRQLTSTRTGELFGRQKDLSSIAGLNRFKVFHEVLESGHRSASAHWHTRKEEFLYILKGAPTLRLGERICVLKQGDFVGFPAGTGEFHELCNASEDVVEFLIGFCDDPGDETVFETVTTCRND